MTVVKKELTESELKTAIEDGWDMKTIMKGYIASSADFMNGAVHIEKLDCVDAFETDDDAAKYAEEHDGVKLIHDIPTDINECDKANYLDTETNRRLIAYHLKKVYNKDWE